MRRFLARTLAVYIVAILITAVLLPIALVVGWNVFWWSLGFTLLVIAGTIVLGYALWLLTRFIYALWHIE